MNIDLLLTSQGEAGLVSDEIFTSSIAGVMYDAQSGQLTLEFGDAEPLELNINVVEDCGNNLLQAHSIHVGAIENGMIAESRQVPLVLQNDPFGGGNYGSFPIKPRSSVLAFENFMKRASSGQPVHRDDLGDETHAGSVLGGMSAAVMQFAPNLTRQRAMEAAPRMAGPAPRAPGMAPGSRMGGGGGGTPPPRQQRPIVPDEDDGE
ncbi:MAG TPA: hypothetical protein VL625_12425 [Patescibacteria group bacterium]|nr:hypothetical protein [Patescibacteria group bacterium]